MKTTRPINAVLQYAFTTLAMIGLLFTARSAKAASLAGESVTVEIRYQVSPQGGAFIDHLITAQTVTVGAGVEVSQAFTFTYLSGGFNQTINGTVTADVSGNGMIVGFSGQEQPGALVYTITSVTDQSAASITSATQTAFTENASFGNQGTAPTFSNTGTGSISCGFFLAGFQPGQTMSQTIAFVLADAGGAPEIAVEQPLGTNIPDGGSKSFGSAYIGSSLALTFTVKNTGTANLTGLTFNATDGPNPGDFVITNNLNSPITGPSGTDTFRVTFTPGGAGPRSAVIHLVSNDSDENPFDITVSGTGVALDGPAGTSALVTAGTVGSFDWPFNCLARKASTDEVFGFWRKDSGAAAVYSLIKWNGSGWTTLSSFTPANAGFTSASDYTSLAIDGTGAFHVAISGEIGSGLNSERGVFYATSANGTTWSYTKVETYTDPSGWKNTSHPQIRVDSANHPHIAFDFDDVNGTRRYSSRYRWFDGAVWQGAGAAGDVYVNAGNASNEVNGVTFALDSNNKAHFVMQSETNGSGTDASLIYVNNVSGSFSAPVTLAAGATGQAQGIGANIVIDGAGKLHVVHTDFQGHLNYVTNASGSFVSTWINGNVIGFQGGECLSRNSAGDLFVVYAAGSAGIQPLHYARLPGATGSVWTIGEILPKPVSPADGGNFFSGIITNSLKFFSLFDFSPAPGAPPRSLYSSNGVFPGGGPPPPAPISSPAGDVVTGGGAPDATGADSGTKFDVLKRGGFLAENGNLVFPGYLLVGTGGVTTSPNNYMGLWKDAGSGLKLFARSGDNAPETGATAAKYDVLPQTPAINDSGEVTFLASLVVSSASSPATTVDNDTGLWSELGSTGLGILMREGDTIPPVTPLQIGTFASGCYATAHTGASTGEAAFAVTMKNGSTDTAILRASVTGPTVTTVGVVARQNTAMPGVAGEQFGNLAGSYSDSIRMDATGNLSFVALSASGRESIWYQPVAGGAPVKAFIAGTAATGDTAPGTGGATFKNIKSPSIGSAGTISFRGFLNNNGDNTGGKKGDGIWRGTTGGGFTCILRAGDDNTVRPGLGLPAGALVGNLWHSWLTNANHGAWRGWLDVNGNGTSSTADGDVNAIYTDLSGTMVLKLKVGDAAPGIAGATLASFDLPVVGGVEQMAFLGTVTGGGTTTSNNKGVWRSASNGGAVSLVLRTGDTMSTTQGTKTIANVDFPGSNTTDRRWEQPVMDSTGRLLVYVTFVGGATCQVLVP